MAERLLPGCDETCLICGKPGSGIHIQNQLICDACQEKMVVTDVDDWKYRYFVAKLSAIQAGKRAEAGQTG